MYDRNHVLPDDYPDLFCSFLISLPPLKSLTLTGPVKPNMCKSIIDHHGKTLRLLRLKTSGCLHSVVFNSDLVNELQQNCQLLEDLELSIRRSKGDRQEQNIYKTLGAINKLQRLISYLDCANRSTWRDPDPEEAEEIILLEDPSFDDFHQLTVFDYGSGSFPPRNGHLRDALINGAVDETIARAIFQSISAGKGHNSIPLERLDLYVKDADHFGKVDREGMAVESRYLNETHSLRVEDLWLVRMEDMLTRWEEAHDNKGNVAGFNISECKAAAAYLT